MPDVGPEEALNAAYSLLVGLDGPDHEYPDQTEYEKVMEKVESGLKAFDNDIGLRSKIKDVTPIEHREDNVVLRLCVYKIESSRSGDDVVVRAVNESKTGMEFAAAIKNPMVPSLSINDILRVSLKVEQ